MGGFMTIFDLCKHFVLAAAIALTIPCTLYWGIQTMVPQTVPAHSKTAGSEETDDTIQKQDQKTSKEPIRKIQFWTFMLGALVCIGFGAVIKLPSLSLGLMGAGLLNLLMGVANALQPPIYNFVVLIAFLISLAAIALKNSFK